MNYENVVITGASTGLGFELAKQLSKSSQNLVVCPRDPQRLESAIDELKDGATAQIHSFAADLSTSTGTDAFINYLDQSGLRIDLFVNNVRLWPIRLLRRYQGRRTRGIDRRERCGCCSTQSLGDRPQLERTPLSTI